MSDLFFLIGLPRSGKSTICKKWAMDEICIKDHVITCEYDILSVRPKAMVCADQIRLACGHRWNSYVEGYVDACKHTVIRTLLYDHDVIVDGTHTTKSSMARLFEIHPQAHYLYVDTHPSICKDRAAQTNQSDLIPVINRMHEQLLHLTSAKTHDDITQNMWITISNIACRTTTQNIVD